MKPLFLLFTLSVACFCRAQSLSWQDFVELLQDDEYAEEQNWADHMEELAYLNAHPLDINTATREDLQ